MTEITSLRPQNCEEISDIHIVPVAQAKKGWTDKKKDSSQHGAVYASAGLLVVTKRVPSDAYYKAKRSETGGKVSISNERYRSNTESQMVSRGVHLRIIPCPAGIQLTALLLITFTSYLPFLPSVLHDFIKKRKDMVHNHTHTSVIRNCQLVGKLTHTF
jgi:hypothetical protein